MKKAITILIIPLLLGGCPLKGMAQADESAQLLLNVEKLHQFKQILQDMYKGYEILSQGYRMVRDVAEGNFSLHRGFIEGLSQVSPTVKRYRKVGYIIDYQQLILQEYQRAYRRLVSRGNFTRQETEYLLMVYRNLLDISLKNLEELALVVTGGKLQMSDDERIAAIDRIFDEIRDRYVFIRVFNSEATVLDLQRKKAKGDLKTIKNLRP